MKNPMNENNVNGFQELIWEYLSATRSFQPNTNVPLKMLGALLYLAKTRNLCQSSNIQSNDSAVLLYMDKSYVDTIAGTMSASWEEKGIYNIGICSRLSKDDFAYTIVSKYAKDLRKVSDPIDIFALAEKLIKWNLSSDDYLEIFDFAIQQYMTTIGKAYGEFSQPKEIGSQSHEFIMRFYIESICRNTFICHRNSSLY